LSNEYLVTYDRYTATSGYDILARRIDATTLVTKGAVSNVTGTVTGWQYLAAVARDTANNRYLVTWSDERNVQARQIRGRLVSAAGSVLGSDIIVAAPSPNPYGLQPAVAYSPIENRYLVMLTARQYNPPMQGHYVSPDGQLVDDPLIFSDAAGWLNVAARTASVNATDPHWMTVWESNTDIYGQELPPAVPPVSLVTLSITDSQGNPVNALALNSDGWPVLNVADGVTLANPLRVIVNLNCPVTGSPCNSDALLVVSTSLLKGRFHVTQEACDTGTIEPSMNTYAGYCGVQAHINPGETKELDWSIWVQPSESTNLNFSVTWGDSSDSKDVQTPQAAIHPIVFLPGLGATLPPTTDQSQAHLVLSIASLAAHYTDLYDALEKMGYEMDKTLFLFPYDWLRSNIFSARLLRERLETASQTASAVPWVAESSNPANITFDLIGHSTGNLVARTYIQVSEGVDPTTDETFPIWNGHVRKWVSIAGPLQGIYDGYQVFEGITIPDTPLDPVWMAFNIFAPPRAVEAGYATGICPPQPLPQACVYYWTTRDKYLFAHDPFVGPSILPEFLPVYTTPDNMHFLVSADPLQYHETPLGDLPYGRLANPLLEDVSVVNGTIQDPLNVFLVQSRYLFYGDIERAVMLSAMREKVYDPYKHNPFLADRAPVGYEPTYYGLNTEEGIRTLDERLNGVGENLCLIFGGGTAQDTPTKLKVHAPSTTAPYWFSGARVSFENGAGDGYVADMSSNPVPIWRQLIGKPIPIDVDLELPENAESIHQYIAGYDETIRHVAQCLNGVIIPDGMLSGFSSDQNSEAQANEARLTNNILSITALSPVELTLTDSLGRRLGYDPQTGADISEIPNALYFRDLTTADKHLIVYAVEAGDYLLTVTGIGEGTYTIIGTFKQGDVFVSPLFIQGTTHLSESFARPFHLAASASDMPTPPDVYAGLIFSANEGETIQFAGSVTDINSGDTLAYHWNFGDGASADGMLAPTHTYADDGNYDVTLKVTDSSGFVVADKYSLTVNNLSPTVEAGNNLVYSPGQSVAFSGSFTDPGILDTHTIEWDFGDGTSATGTLTPTHSYTSVGAYTIKLTVSDDDGGVGSDTLTVNIQFTFTGFFSPVDNLPILNTVKAGQSIPVKFSLGSNYGLNIFSTSYPSSSQVTCGNTAEDAIEETVTAGNSGLSYSAGNMQYTYVWKTDKAWAGTCRTFVFKLVDGTYHRVNFKFK
jgi:PKD repeat protein